MSNSKLPIYSTNGLSNHEPNSEVKLSTQLNCFDALHKFKQVHFDNLNNFKNHLSNPDSVDYISFLANAIANSFNENLHLKIDH